MSFFPDMGTRAFVVGGDHVRAVGWLHRDHPYTKGAVPPAFLTRLNEFISRFSHTGDLFCFPGCGGLHTCECCKAFSGGDNYGVPRENLLFVFPEMIVHYIEKHGYKPPDEFLAAVLASPYPDTEEFENLTEPFWHLHRQAQEEAFARRGL